MSCTKRRHWLEVILLSCAAFAQPTVAQQHCGAERWSVKTGTDADAQRVDLAHPRSVSISSLIALPAPHPIPKTTRVEPTETTVFVVDATLTDYKLEGGAHGDSDYHLVLRDNQGNTMVAEIPSPACVGAGSAFSSQIASARSTFDGQLTAGSSFQTANVPVRVTGVGFFDFAHGQHGAAPNVIELHPVLDIEFNPQPSRGQPSEGGTAVPTAASSVAQDWEYQAISAASQQDVIDLANKLSAQKWEMISVVGAGTGGYVAFFKRAKQ